MLALTVVCGTLLWTFRPAVPAGPAGIWYQVVGNQSEPAWGDGSDCTNVNGTQQCHTLPAFDVLFTQQTSGGLSLNLLHLDFLCNGTEYLSASLASIEWVPGTPSTPGGSAPQLGHCGTYTPPSAAFNRFAYFQQLAPGAPNLQPGDEIVVYAHTFTTFNDDDFHGAPPWCYSVPGACDIEISYSVPPASFETSISLYGIAS